MLRCTDGWIGPQKQANLIVGLFPFSKVRRTLTSASKNVELFDYLGRQKEKHKGEDMRIKICSFIRHSGAALGLSACGPTTVVKQPVTDPAHHER